MTLVLANGQLVFGIVLLMLLMWMFTVVTFLVSRMAFSSSAASVEEYGEPMIVVDSPLLSERSGDARLAPAAAVDSTLNANQLPLPAFALADDFRSGLTTR